MTPDDHVALIREGAAEGGSWADLGSGTGAFTRALATLLGDAARIYAEDRDAGALRTLQRDLGSRFPLVRAVHADFTEDMPIPRLDGILMANSLHFHADACAVLSHAARWLRPGGRLIIIEYDIETANPWVPYPLPWARLAPVLECAGLSRARLLGTRPSRFHRRVYAAACDATGAGPR